MCGIWALVEKDNSNNDIAKYLADFWNLKHRGPENSYFQTFTQTYVGFHRLPIIILKKLYREKIYNLLYNRSNSGALRIHYVSRHVYHRCIISFLNQTGNSVI